MMIAFYFIGMEKPLVVDMPENEATRLFADMESAKSNGVWSYKTSEGKNAEMHFRRDRLKFAERYKPDATA